MIGPAEKMQHVECSEKAALEDRHHGYSAVQLLFYTVPAGILQPMGR